MWLHLHLKPLEWIILDKVFNFILLKMYLFNEIILMNFKRFNHDIVVIAKQNGAF